MFDKFKDLFKKDVKKSVQDRTTMN